MHGEFMTSHVHLMIGSSGNPLENIMRDKKTYFRTTASTY